MFMESLQAGTPAPLARFCGNASFCSSACKQFADQAGEFYSGLMKRIRHLVLAGALACLFAAAERGPDAVAAEPRRLKVLTSFLPIYCFASNVAGELADVENLLPGGVGPHDYQFSRKDAQKVNAADLIVVNGLQLEGWIDKLIQSAASGRPKTVVEASAGLQSELIFGLPHPHRESAAEKSAAERSIRPGEQKHANPHIWLDPRLAMHAVTNILSALQKVDPANAAGYGANAAGYLARLRTLDAELETALAPARNCAVVTYHDAFPYFARRYGLDVVGVIEEVPEVDPSPKHLASLQRVVRQSRVKVILTEPPFSSKLARQIGRDLQVPVAELDTLETGPLRPGAYEEGLRRNLRVLQNYLK